MLEDADGQVRRQLGVDTYELERLALAGEFPSVLAAACVLCLAKTKGKEMSDRRGEVTVNRMPTNYLRDVCFIRAAAQSQSHARLQPERIQVIRRSSEAPPAAAAEQLWQAAHTTHGNGEHATRRQLPVVWELKHGRLARRLAVVRVLCPPR